MNTSTTLESCTITMGKSFAQEALLRRVRGEFREMPGMRLTLEQAMRLWTLDRRTCLVVLDSLVTAKFLEQDCNGRYVMAHGGY